MNIHQLQASYVMEQDRILVRMNTRNAEELRLWLTRRMVRHLFPHLTEVTTEMLARQAPDSHHDGANISALKEFKKQESLQRCDFSTPFNSQVTAWPVGDAPLLASTVRLTPGEAGTLCLRFEENLPGAPQTRSFSVTLDHELLHGFLHLLESALQHADWGIALVQGLSSKDSSTLDDSDLVKPPQYLN